jgi:hypothetical protein
MTFKCGIVGLPNVGKSTLFNALTQTASAQAENYPFCTIEPNIGKVAVPDERLQKLTKIANSAVIIPTQIEFVDIAGLVKGASKGEGLGNQFLSHIREVDAIVNVIRCFDDENIVHVEGKINPIRDLELKDADERKIFNNLQLITAKPQLFVCNLSETEVLNGNEYSALVEKIGKENNVPVLKISAQVESEIANLESNEEKQEFLEAIGLKETGLSQIIRTGYNLLDLITFFTVGPKECHGWQLKKGSSAPQAAGVIHTDFEKGFIRAETISYNDYIQFNGEEGCKNAGKLRLEGKDYIAQDGDVFHFRFNV